MNSDWNLIIGCSLLCIAGKLFLEHLHRLRKVKHSKIGTLAAIFGIVMLSTLAFVGPDIKQASQIERNEIVIKSELRDNPEYNKVALDVYATFMKHGDRPTKDHVAYKGEWVTVRMHHRLLAEDKKGKK